ncbi:hypothetical protein M2305_000060 [Gluconobacter cerinus]|uniref:hypothetical protein n=1 Tax=Gluconobacter cerinus TaxID=38307 RepID=UPI0022278A7D|nr:hypothetical protein [Gluconobacter cerinus]MCW2264113.1 hypothetical protein [Gluconobacter cerinus]
MPERLTAENGAKAELNGEFYETYTRECTECEGDGLGYACPHTQGESRCEVCNGTGELIEHVPVQWTTIKEIYKRAVALLGKPQDEAIAEAVAAEREKNDALIRSLAVGYERMRGVLCKMAATSGPDTSWYRHQATQGMDSVPGIWDIAKIPVEAEPGECSWINRDGSLEAIRSAAK